jgi:hypothetical protein
MTMQKTYAFHNAPISSDELEMLHTKRWCGEQACELTSKQAEDGAVEQIDWSQFGVYDPDRLLDMLQRP